MLPYTQIQMGRKNTETITTDLNLGVVISMLGSAIGDILFFYYNNDISIYRLTGPPDTSDLTLTKLRELNINVVGVNTTLDIRHLR